MGGPERPRARIRAHPPFVAVPEENEDGTSDLCGGNFINPLTGGLGDGQRFPRTGGPFGYNGAFFYARLNVNF